MEINLQRFDLDRDGDVLLAAQVAVEGKRSASRAGGTHGAAGGWNDPGAGRGDEHRSGTTRRHDCRDAGGHWRARSESGSRPSEIQWLVPQPCRQAPQSVARPKPHAAQLFEFGERTTSLA